MSSKGVINSLISWDRALATVYIARDTKNNRIYAVKIMHIEFSDDGELLARFQREADILSHLSDPHIVKIFDYGDENDIHYILMDYIDGQNLKYHTLTQGPMDEFQLRSITLNKLLWD